MAAAHQSAVPLLLLLPRLLRRFAIRKVSGETAQQRLPHCRHCRRLTQSGMVMAGGCRLLCVRAPVCPAVPPSLVRRLPSFASTTSTAASSSSPCVWLNLNSLNARPELLSATLPLPLPQPTRAGGVSPRSADSAQDGCDARGTVLSTDLTALALCCGSYSLFACRRPYGGSKEVEDLAASATDVEDVTAQRTSAGAGAQQQHSSHLSCPLFICSLLTSLHAVPYDCSTLSTDGWGASSAPFAASSGGSSSSNWFSLRSLLAPLSSSSSSSASPAVAASQSRRQQRTADRQSDDAGEEAAIQRAIHASLHSSQPHPTAAGSRRDFVFSVDDDEEEMDEELRRALAQSLQDSRGPQGR